MSNQNLPSIPQHVKDTVTRYFKDVAKKLPVLKTIQPLDPEETNGITGYNHFQAAVTEDTAEQMWQRDVVCTADVIYFKENNPLLSIAVYRRVPSTVAFPNATASTSVPFPSSTVATGATSHGSSASRPRS